MKIRQELRQKKYNLAMAEENIEEELQISRLIILYKIISGFLEIMLGSALLIFGRELYRFYLNFQLEELFEDPHGLLASFLQKAIPYIFEHQGNIVLILFLLGTVKVAGAVGLLYHKHWGLDLLVGLTIILLPFEGANLLTHPSLTQFAYFSINLLIAFYLVNFKPKQYFHQLKRRIKS